MSALARPRHFVAMLSFMAATALAVVALSGQEVDAASNTRRLAGTFDIVVDPTPGCPGVCANVDFRGVIQGHGEGPAPIISTALAPSHFVAGIPLTVHTREGDLLLAGDVVFNPDPASDGALTFLFEIVGGTGQLSGASGYLSAAGTADIPGVSASRMLYTGKLVRP
jgi:hypothetical protein